MKYRSLRGYSILELGIFRSEVLAFQVLETPIELTPFLCIFGYFRENNLPPFGMCVLSG